MKKRTGMMVAAGVAALAAVLAGTGYAALQMTSVQDALFERAVKARAGVQTEELLSRDALHVVLCGTGSPLPDPERGSACAAIFAGGHFFLVDAGAGAAVRLARFGVPMGGLSGVLLTHFHSDHMAGLPDVSLQSWAAGRHAPLTLYGPPGVERVARGFEEAFKLDAGYRTAHHGAELMPPSGGRYAPVTVPLLNDFSEAVVFDEDGVKITAFRVGHAPVEPAYGYRIDYEGRSVIFSGDTVKHPNMARMGKGADVMVHEALAGHMVSAIAEALEPAQPHTGQILRDTINYHTSPVQAAESANEAGVPLLVYSHVVPPLPNAIARTLFLRGVEEVRGEGVMVGYDGLYLRLPVDGGEIEKRDLR